MSSPANTRPATSPRPLADDPRVKRRIDIPARQHHDRVLARRELAREQRRERRPRRPARPTSSCCSQAKRTASATSASLTDSALRVALAQDAEGDRRHARGLERVAEGVAARRARPARSRRARASAPCRPSLRARRRRSPRPGTASAMPEASPPPPHGMTIRAGGAAELLDDLEPDRALPGDDRRIVEARHHGRAGLVGDPRGDLLAALGPAVVEDDLGALAARALDLHLRRVGRHDDDRPDAEPPRGDRHAARVIARREGDHAALPLLRRELQQPVGRAPQLERAAGLQALAFEPDARARDLAFDQRRALDQAGDPLRPRRRTSSRVTSAHLELSWLIFHPFD